LTGHGPVRLLGAGSGFGSKGDPRWVDGASKPRGLATQSGNIIRMRLVLLALFSLVLVAPQAADAARREEPRTASARPQAGTKPPVTRPASAPQRSSATAPQRSSANAPRQAARPQQGSRTQQTARAGDVRTQRTGIVVRGASAATVSRDASANCTRRNGRTVCGGRSGVAGWQAGLPAVDYAQTDCPAGTFATLARGHENVVRCMPI
jgi:hypothetical protein